MPSTNPIAKTADPIAPSRTRRALPPSEALRRARRALAKGEPDAALDLVASVVARFPQHRAARDLHHQLLSQSPALPAGRTQAEKAKLDALTAAFRAQEHETVVTLGRELVEHHDTCALLHNLIGEALRSLGRPSEAIAPFLRAIGLRPGYPEAILNLGRTYSDMHDPLKAIAVFGQLIEHETFGADAFNNIGTVLKEMGDHTGAYAAFTRAIELQPKHYVAYSNRGATLKVQGRVDEALADFQTALTLCPTEPATYANAAVTLRGMGRNAEAATCLRQVLRIKPNETVALLTLAGIVKGDEARDLQEQLAAALGRSRSDSPEAMRLHYGLSKTHFALKAAPEAMAHLAEAGRIGKANTGYDIADEERLFVQIARLFAPPPDPLPEDPSPAPIPIFVLGMPRSGTTLLEQMIGTHPLAHAAGELEHLRRSVLQARALDAPLSPAKFQHIRARYLEALGRLAPDSARFVVDKMPLNFRFVGHIACAFPEARIVYANRPAEAVCWSNYQRFFPAIGMRFNLDQRDTARFYRLHEQLMAFWQAAYPGRIIPLDYDALTQAPEAESQKLFAALGLEWQPSVLDFHRPDRLVNTASSQQVRQKIYTGSSEKWRDYAPWLGPMLEELQGYRPPGLPTPH